MQKVKVAVYGSLKRGLGNHRVLSRNEHTYLGTTKLKPEWTMYSLGSFPALVHRGNQEPVVEVYEVALDTLTGPLDALEGYPSFYNRTVVPTEFGNAWVYFIAEDSSYVNTDRHPVVEGADWGNSGG